MSNALGIDVSNNNGPVDWAQHPDISFAAAKCIEGPVGGSPMFYDPTFAENWREMWDRYNGKVVRFAYAFGHPAYDAIEQADALTSTVREHGLEKGDHFWLDLEPYPGLATPDDVPAADVAEWSRKFCARVNSNCPDHRCMVYVNPATAEAGCCAGLWPWRLVVADWDVPQPRVPQPWAGRGLPWRIWQYRGTGLDRDIFNGDREALNVFARMPAGRR